MGANTRDEMYAASFPMSRKNVNLKEVAAKKMEYQRRRGSVSQGQGGGQAKRRWLCMNYFSSESFVLLVCLTASVLILPLILPPLPPPPFMLLLLPICILVVLVILAFSPSTSSGQSMAHPYPYL
nr:protein AUXIN-REGULATED GENE INVOLVED IN ORGAN SIZE [Ipomoea batatas]